MDNQHNLRFIRTLILALGLCQLVSAQQIKYDFPEVADLPETEGLQNPFLKPDGTLVPSKEEWPAQREYLKAMLIHYQYGTIPPDPEEISMEEVSSEEVLDGTGIMDLFNVTVTRNGKSVTLHCSLYRPNKPGKFPVVIKNDRGITEKDEIVSKAIDMGYCIAKYAREDLAKDHRSFVRKGGAYDVYPEYTWGAIGVWAWGYQLVIDAFEQMDCIDLGKILTTGHSRGGKTALAGAIFDERVAIAGPNSSGLGGTASARIFEEKRSAQDIQISLERKPHWWGPRWYEFAENEKVMPFDAHFNKIVLAPRGLHNAHATEDYWANPLGTELTHRVAKKVYKWLGVEENIGLHWRPGGHAQNLVDWTALLDFADLYFYGRDHGNEFNRLVYPDASLPIKWELPLSPKKRGKTHLSEWIHSQNIENGASITLPEGTHHAYPGNFDYRYLHISNNDEGEFLSSLHASLVWKLLELPGLTVSELAPVNAPLQDGYRGCHLRDGKHDLGLSEWNWYMDFADKHMTQP